MSKSQFTEISKFISQELDITNNSDMNKEQDILDMITNRVLELLDKDPGLLFSYIGKGKNRDLSQRLNTNKSLSKVGSGN